VQFVAAPGIGCFVNAFVLNALNTANHLLRGVHALEVQSAASYAHTTPMERSPMGGCSGDGIRRPDVCDGQILLKI
jgi:hypothetical protein